MVVQAASSAEHPSAAGVQRSLDIIAFYEERAKGGTGLIIIEITRVMNGHGAGMPNQLAPKRLLGAFLNNNDNYQTTSSICYEYRPEETQRLMPHIFNGYDGWMVGDVER